MLEIKFIFQHIEVYDTVHGIRNRVAGQIDQRWDYVSRFYKYWFCPFTYMPASCIKKNLLPGIL